jgi:hypothetical protein
VDERENEFRLGRDELFPVGTVDGDIAEGSGTVVLDVDILGGEEGNENGDGTGVDELLSVIIYSISQ